MILVCFQVKSFNITVTQVYAPTNKAKEAKVDQFYDDLKDLLEVTPKKKKKKKMFYSSLGTGSQEIPGVTGKFVLREQNEAGQRLTEFCQENALVIANTFLQQHKR